MKNLFAALLIIFFSTNSFTQTINDLIQPINLNEEGETKVIISDLYYAEDYNVKFDANEFVTIFYNSRKGEITFLPRENFKGLSLVSFSWKGNAYQIPVALRKSKKYLFSYKPEKPSSSINLFGQFNSWNRQSLPMADEDGDGTYETSINLEPGRYEYKYFVDGEELVDHANPIKVPNGMGDFNSIRVIEESSDEKVFLHTLGMNKKNDAVVLSYYYESSSNQKDLSELNLVALFDNQMFPFENILIDEKKVGLILNGKLLLGEHTVRLTITDKGNISNTQTVRIKNGKIAGNSDQRYLEDQIIYSIMIDRFFDGDPKNNAPVVHDSLFAPANYQGGDLQGIITKMKEGYFDSLGINTFWISPIIDNTPNAYREYPAPHRYYTGYHGYWPTAWDKVEEHFGDMKLAKKLIKEAHKKEINTLLDFVSNHIHQENPLWKDHRDWFGIVDLPDGRKNLRLWDEYRLTTWFEPYMPSFDYVGSRAALEFMTDNAVWWLKETNADGFRHDAVKHVPNEFWRLLTQKLKKNIEVPKKKKLYQIGETFGGIDLISSYVNNGQLNSQFNFNIYDVAIPTFLSPEASFKLLDYEMQKTFKVYGDNHLMGNLVDSHDKIRYMAYADGDLEVNDGRASDFAWTNPPTVDHPSSYDKMKSHLAFILTIPGVPVIYYGAEFGMTGAADPDNRRMMRFGDDLNELEKQTLKEVRKLVGLRKNHSSLRHGDFLTLQADENIYAYLRSDMNERVLTIINKNSNEQNVTLNFPSLYNLNLATDLLKGTKVKIVNDSLTKSVSGFGYIILKLD